MSNVLEVKDILLLGNEGTPEEWLAHLTGEGIGNGFEGIDDDVMDALLSEDSANDPFMPVLPIEATPEIQFYQCKSTNYTKGRGGNKPTHILVHYTSGKKTAEGAALANCKYFNRETAGASAHFFIDSGYTIWQSVSLNDTAWHAGNWNMNQRSIGIEVCSAGEFTKAEIERLTWLVQYLMDKYDIPASRVIRHYDVTGKKCPAYYVNASRWATLHKTITTKKKVTSNSNKSNKEKNETFKVKFKEDMNIRKGAGTEYAKLSGERCEEGYTYTIIKTKKSKSGVLWGKLKSYANSDYGWVCIADKYCKRV